MLSQVPSPLQQQPRGPALARGRDRQVEAGRHRIAGQGKAVIAGRARVGNGAAVRGQRESAHHERHGLEIVGRILVGVALVRRQAGVNFRRVDPGRRGGNVKGIGDGRGFRVRHGQVRGRKSEIERGKGRRRGRDGNVHRQSEEILQAVEGRHGADIDRGSHAGVEHRPLGRAGDGLHADVVQGVLAVINAVLHVLLGGAAEGVAVGPERGHRPGRTGVQSRAVPIQGRAGVPGVGVIVPQSVAADVLPIGDVLVDVVLGRGLPARESAVRNRIAGGFVAVDRVVGRVVGAVVVVGVAVEIPVHALEESHSGGLGRAMGVAHVIDGGEPFEVAADDDFLRHRNRDGSPGRGRQFGDDHGFQGVQGRFVHEGICAGRFQQVAVRAGVDAAGIAVLAGGSAGRVTEGNLAARHVVQVLGQTVVPGAPHVVIGRQGAPAVVRPANGGNLAAEVVAAEARDLHQQGVIRLRRIQENRVPHDGIVVKNQAIARLIPNQIFSPDFSGRPVGGSAVGDFQTVRAHDAPHPVAGGNLRGQAVPLAVQLVIQV